jgi:hypothetical protein
LKISVLKNIEFTMLVISLAVITVVVVDIFTASKEQEHLQTFAIIWICNMVGVISNIIKRK